MSRRGLLALVGGGPLLLLGLAGGQIVGRPGTRHRAARAAGRVVSPATSRSTRQPPAGASPRPTSVTAGVSAVVAGERGGHCHAPLCWRCHRPQRGLPIACVEGWSTTQTWTGVTARRPAGDGRCRPRRRHGDVAAAPRCLRSGPAGGQPGRRSPLAARAGREREAADPGPRLSRRGSSSRPPPASTAPSGCARSGSCGRNESRRIRRHYGASAGHLVALLVGGAIAAYAVTRVPDLGTLGSIALWFGFLLIAHDLLLFPVYAAVDNAAAPATAEVGHTTGAMDELRAGSGRPVRHSADRLVPPHPATARRIHPRGGA